jgi:hypothetical protein
MPGTSTPRPRIPETVKVPLYLFAFALPVAVQQPAPLTATDIMARVAAHQDNAEADRAHYIYVQHARVTSHKGKTVMCEETTDSRVTPGEKGSHQQLLKLNGRVLQKGTYVTYTDLPKSKDATDHDLNISIGGDDSDRNLVEGMRNDFTNDERAGGSKDGIQTGLFPLTTRSLKDEDFKLLGREKMQGRDVYHITFTPKDKSDYGWKGDAYIDTTALQPVLVHTTMSRNIPLAVRMLLGTSVPGLGFSITYAPQPDGVWFPSSFGTEFRIKFLFFYSRQVTVYAENRDFEKTHVTSTILETPPAPVEP